MDAIANAVLDSCEPEFIGGEVDLRINICRGQINANGVKDGVENGNELATIGDLDQSQRILKFTKENNIK